MLSFGTAGCNLACKFCQNWDISKSREMDRLTDQASPEAIARRRGARWRRERRLHLQRSGRSSPEYAMDVADACHARGIKTVAVTAGYIHEAPRREFYAKMDAANVDLKAFTDEFYRKQTASSLEPVLGHPALPGARNERLVRDHHPADPRPRTTPTRRSRR